MERWITYIISEDYNNVLYSWFSLTLSFSCLEITFPRNTEAEIACNTLKVDKEPPRSSVEKVLSVEGNKLIV